MNPGLRAVLLVLGAAASCSSPDAPTGGAPSAASSVAPPSASASATSSAEPNDASSSAAPAIPTPDRIFVGSTSEHACFGSTDRALYCWGRNDAGQVGREDAQTFYLAGRVPIAEPIVEASLGERQTCAVLASGKVRCFGEDASGRRAPGDDVGGLDDVAHLASGADFTCALRRDGALLCFGRVPGHAGVARAAEPIFAAGIPVKAIAISAAARAMCALMTPELVACIGDNPGGALVKGGPARLAEPTPIAELEKPIKAIAMADDGVCALAESGRVTCHGGAKWEGTAMYATSQFAYAADGVGCGVHESYVSCRSATESTRRLEDARGAFREVGVGRGFACALPAAPGPVVCWGDNKYGALGASPLRPRATPIEIERLRGATRIEAGDASACGLVGHAIRCFGDHDRKEKYGNRRLGDDSAEQIVRADDIAVGGGIRCGITDGLASCWGDNRNSGIISENPGVIETPTTLASLGKPKRLTFGATHACALAEDGTVRCWGGAGRARTTPREVTGLGDVHMLEAGGRRVCALLADGGVSCAAFDGPAAFTAARVPGMRGLVALAVGGRHACGIDAKGAVVCFGENDQGQLGRNPAGVDGVVVVTELPPTRAVSAGDAFTCALGADAKVRCWGASGEGQLGRPDESMGRVEVSLAAVDGLAAVKAIAAGERHACALQDDGKVFCWGDRKFGRFFAKDVETSSDPLPIRLDQLAVP